MSSFPTAEVSFRSTKKIFYATTLFEFCLTPSTILPFEDSTSPLHMERGEEYPHNGEIVG
jgi:hypothetical protein